MIDWLTRTDSGHPFLITEEKTWSYGETAEEVERRASSEPVLLRPGLDAESVFDILAAITGGGALLAGNHLEVAPDARADGSALVVFTSGTTGPAKGVRLTLANLEAAARGSVEHLGHDSRDTWLLTMPLTHVGGVSILVRSVFAGGSVRMLPRFDLSEVVAALSGEVTMVSVVPTMLRRLINHHPGPYHGLKAVLVGGGPIPEGLLEEAAKTGLPVLPTYGMTETFGQVATLRPGAPLRRHVHPLPGVGLRIGADGRIAVKGAQVSPGYLGEPDRLSEWLTTSDVGEIDDEGALRVLGRADSVIITGGENVYPEQVESVLQECPGVSEAVVVGIPDEEWGSAVACLYSGDGQAGAVAGWAKERLPGHMVPKVWRKLEAVPRTPIGKPDRLAAVELL